MRAGETRVYDAAERTKLAAWVSNIFFFWPSPFEATHNSATALPNKNNKIGTAAVPWVCPGMKGVTCPEFTADIHVSNEDVQREKSVGIQGTPGKG